MSKLINLLVLIAMGVVGWLWYTGKLSLSNLDPLKGYSWSWNTVLNNLGIGSRDGQSTAHTTESGGVSGGGGGSW